MTTRPKVCFLLPLLDEPPVPTNIDIEIACNNRISVTIEATNESLQTSKSIPVLSLSKAIEQQTRENSRLRQELVYLYRKYILSLYTFKELSKIKERLEIIVINFYKLIKKIEDKYI
jgi:hypothetical protein